MKIEFELNVKDKNRFYVWMRLFAMQFLMGEDETIINCKVDGKDFPDLYKLHPHIY